MEKNQNVKLRSMKVGTTDEFLRTSSVGQIAIEDLPTTKIAICIIEKVSGESSELPEEERQRKKVNEELSDSLK